MTAKRWVVTSMLCIVAGSAWAGEASFQAANDVSVGGVSGVSSMDAGDIDGDGLADVVAIEGGKHASGRKTFAWFKAPTDIQGTWQRCEFNEEAPLRSFLGAAKLADMDGDGDLDLVVSSDRHSGGKREADVFVFVNPRPEGRADAAWTWHSVTDGPMHWHHINDMEIADMDGDGRPDIVVRSLEPNQIHIFFQDDLRSFVCKSIDTNLSQSEGLGVGHIDTDGLMDITYTGYWLQSPSIPRVEDYVLRPIDPGYSKVNQNTKEALGDIDGDGRTDVVIAPAEAYRNGGDHDLAWYRNPGTDWASPWAKTVIRAKTNNHHTVKLGDVDRDGDPDVVVGVPWGAQRIDIYYNDGKGSFGEPQTIQEGKGLYSGVLADLDADGDLDIVGQDTYARQSKPWVYENMLIDE